MSKRVASVIIRAGGRKNRPIAVYLPKSANVVFADLGIMYSGNIYVNLDVKSPAQRIKNLIENIRPELVITCREFAGFAEQFGLDPRKVVIVEDAIADDVRYDNEAILRGLEDLIDTDPLCIINTSGSTGLQKSAVLSHRGFIDFTDWAVERLGIGEDEVIGSLSPVFFDIYSFELCLLLARSATIVLIPEKLAGFPARMMDFLRAGGVNFIFWVPTVMVNIANLDILGKVEPPALRTIWFAGEVFPTKHVNYWRRHLPETKFVNLYGPIEITLDCTYYVLDREFADDEPIPIGFPCRNTDILILNEKNEPAKPGEPGELCVRGTGLAMGYWNNPDNTARAFVQNPLNPHYPETIYRTGDLVFRNDAGRSCSSAGGTSRSSTSATASSSGRSSRPSSARSTASTTPASSITRARRRSCCSTRRESEIPPSELRRKLSEVLPKYMIPTEFHHLTEMPRNPNGKIDRNLLNTRLNEGTAVIPVGSPRFVLERTDAVRSLSRTVETNFFAGRDVLESWTRAGLLFHEEIGQSSFFFRKDADFFHLFYVSPSCDDLGKGLDGLAGRAEILTADVVTKTASKAPVLDVFRENGFHVYNTLVRMCRTGNPGGEETRPVRRCPLRLGGRRRPDPRRPQREFRPLRRADPLDRGDRG